MALDDYKYAFGATTTYSGTQSISQVASPCVSFRRNRTLARTTHAVSFEQAQASHLTAANGVLDTFTDNSSTGTAAWTPPDAGAQDTVRYDSPPEAEMSTYNDSTISVTFAKVR